MKKFPVDPENTQAAVKYVLEYVNDRLKSYHLKHKDELKSSLMAEESLLRLMDYADFSKVRAIFVKVMRIFGTVRIKLRVPGENSALRRRSALRIFLMTMTRICPTLSRQYRT